MNIEKYNEKQAYRKAKRNIARVLETREITRVEEMNTYLSIRIKPRKEIKSVFSKFEERDYYVLKKKIGTVDAYLQAFTEAIGK